jgi:thiol-disulfide isomerase/thioredoxin
MRLEQKYFIPFILGGAVITMIFIVFSSFNFKQQQENRFARFTTEYDSLLIVNHPQLTVSDSVSLGDYNDKPLLVVFWASWSDKSANMMSELAELSRNYNQLNIVAALVKDATDSAMSEIPNYPFIYIDGTVLFNELRVPGIPSYFILDENGNLINTNVGYSSGEVEVIPEIISSR